MKKIVDIATYIHGHLGPFLVLGLKAGQLAIELIGRDPMKSHAGFKLPLKRPYTCFIDGFMICTGCTPGKLNLEVEESSDGIMVRYLCGDQHIIIRVREEVLREVLSKLASGIDSRTLAFQTLKLPDNLLFEYSTNRVEKK